MTSSLFMATTAPGLEHVAEAEIGAKLAGAWTHATFRGRILFGCTERLERVSKLRSVDNLFAHVAWFKVGPHKSDLRQLTETVAQLDLTPALSHLVLPRRRPKAIVSASRSGRHTFSRFEAAEAVMEALVERHGYRRGETSDYDVAFRLDVVDEEALLSIKLTPPAFRFRGRAREFSRAALRPTVAHALVWLSQPEPDDVFLDPFCGSGTLAIERAAYAVRRIVASDISKEAVALTQRNARAQGVPFVEAYRWDASALELETGSVSKIVTNPPWGTQIGAGADLPALYRGFLAEARRVLTPRGRIVMITDQKRAVEEACTALGLPSKALCVVSLHGLVPTVYQIG